MNDTLKITEIFFSLQGETSRMGRPTVFIRLTGCPLRCGYCDSAYAFQGGKTMSFNDILTQVRRHPTHTLCVTGGEPLAQKHSLAFLARLADEGFDVSLETSGALPIENVDPRISRIVDIKTPGSGEMGKMRWENLDAIRSSDEIKFVLCDRADYEWARDLLRNKALDGRAPVLFSPVWETLAPADLAQWILADGLPVRMQVQLHKILWGEKPGV